jgi:histone-arginine methyltransferase CARM1
MLVVASMQAVQAAHATNGPTGSLAHQKQAKAQGQHQQQASEFNQRTEETSANIYFTYYGSIQHQQNMLQDFTRTGKASELVLASCAAALPSCISSQFVSLVTCPAGIYHAAILQNRADFEGKDVMDVGAGSGILSLFAAQVSPTCQVCHIHSRPAFLAVSATPIACWWTQAGARKVYAVEASNMAVLARRLADGNQQLGQVIDVINSKVEEINPHEGEGFKVSAGDSR